MPSSMESTEVKGITEGAIIFSLLHYRLSNLYSIITQYSLSLNKNTEKKLPLPASSLLSSQQIKYAIKHTNNIIKSLMKVIALAQNSKNFVSNEGDAKKLDKILGYANNLLLQQNNKWLGHLRKYFTEFTKQLKNIYPAFLSEEKKINDMISNSMDVALIEENIKTLKGHNIQLPEQLSEFFVVALFTIASITGKDHQINNNNEEIKNIVTKLSVFKDEEEDAEQIRLANKQQDSVVIDNIAAIKNVTETQEDLSKPKDQNLNEEPIDSATKTKEKSH